MTAIKEDDSARNEPLSSAAQDVAFHADEKEFSDVSRWILQWREFRQDYPRTEK